MENNTENKPWWEGKKCSELEGKRVRVTYRNGLEMCDILGPAGVLKHGPSVSYNSLTDEIFTPFHNIASIELLDDEAGYNRIDRIDDVRKGDLFVTRDGSKFKVQSVDPKLKEIMTCRVQTSGYSMPLPDCLFSHALREKPKLRTPDHDGLWKNRDGDVAVFVDGRGQYIFIREDEDCDAEWAVHQPLITSSAVQDNAPWTPCEVAETQEGR